MIYRTLKFQVLHKEGESWKREPVKDIALTDMGVGSVRVDNEDETEIRIDWLNTFLLQFTGSFDKEGTAIYHGELLQDEAEVIYEVLNVCGSFIILDDQGEPILLSDEVCRKMKVIGNVMADRELIEAPIDTSVFETKAPPIVRLKKKV